MTGYERFADAVENDSKTIDVSLKQLERELIKRFRFNESITGWAISQIKEIIYSFMYFSLYLFIFASR